MKTIKKCSLWALALALTLPFVGCSENEVHWGPNPIYPQEGEQQEDPQPPTESEEEPSIVGEWFEDASTSSLKNMVVSNYHENGTVDFWWGYADETTSLYLNYDGTYTLNGTALQQKYVSPINGDNTTTDLEVKSLTKYALTTFLSLHNTTEVAYRIVDTYQLAVGGTKAFQFDDKEFTATSYTTSDASVATVDNAGSITARKRGTAYITAKASVGAAVIRVVVTDTENVIDDYMSFMGGTIDNVTNAYGSNFVEVEGEVFTERQYTLIDEYVEKVGFQYFNGQVLVVNIILRSGVDSDAIVESYKKKYTVEHEGKVSCRFSTEKDDQKYILTYFISDGWISILPYVEVPEPQYNFSSAAFEEFDQLIMMGTATEVAQAFGHQITAEEMEEGSFDIDTENEVFSTVSILFDEDPDSDDYMKIGTVMLMTRAKIKQADIEQWYKDHYTATGEDLNPYISSTTPPYYVSFKDSGARCFVYYKFSKRKK